MSINHRIRRRDAEGSDWRRWVRFERIMGDADQLEGSGVYKVLPFTGQPATVDSMFYACRVRAVDGSRTPEQAGGRMRFFTCTPYNGSSSPQFVNMGYNGDTGGNDEGEVARSTGCNAHGPGLAFPSQLDYFRGASWAGSMDKADEYVLAWSVRGSTGEMKVTRLHYSWGRYPFAAQSGETPHPLTYPSVSNMDPFPSGDGVCWLFGHNYKFKGEVAFCWFHAAVDGSAFVDVETDANQRLLAADPTTWTWHTPLVWFQGTAAQWTGSPGNRGSGGAFTYNNAPLDVAA